MTWFYTLCVIAIVIVTADVKGTLEPTVKKWEQKLGIPVPYDTTEVDTTNIDNEVIIRYRL
mgnify:FL=1